MKIVAQIPTGFTGFWQTIESAGGSSSQSWSFAFNETVPAPNGGSVPNNIEAEADIPMEANLTKAWLYDSAPLSDVVHGCPDKCKAKLVAPALAVTACSSHQVPFDVNTNMEGWILKSFAAPPLSQELFFISTTLVVEENEKINLVTGYTPIFECKGTLNYTACTLESAIGEYEVSIDRQAVTIDADSLRNPRILALSKNVAINYNKTDFNGMHKSTLGGIVECMWTKWESYFAGGTYNGQPQGVSDGTPVSEFVELKADDGSCPSFSDPHPYILADINRLMVYAGMFATMQDREKVQSNMEPKWANAVETTTTGQQVGEESVYQTNFWFFGAAALVELACIVLIAPTYWGWWKLGRPMSFSPLEMAKAFESPLLKDCNSNSSGRDIAKALGKTDIRYGVTNKDSATGAARLVFANPKEVDTPERGGCYDG